MSRTIFHKVVETLITLIFATFIIFVLTRLAPGDPVELLLGHPGEVAMSDTKAYEEKVNELREKLKLNDNIIVQYFTWSKNIIQFDLGNSIHTERPVVTEIIERLPATIILSIAAILIELVLGLTFGIISALKSGKLYDGVIRFICVSLASTPAFIIGLGLLSIFAVTFNLYEISSDVSIKRLWLPSVTLGVIGAPQLIRIVRSDMLSEFGQTYVFSALARGLGRRRAVKHALRNALLPVTTMIALSFTSLLSGAVVIESIFSWPGIGKYALDSILLHDYPVIQGYAFIMVLLVVTINLIVDLLYKFIDPRLCSKGGRKNEEYG